MTPSGISPSWEMPRWESTPLPLPMNGLGSICAPPFSLRRVLTPSRDCNATFREAYHRDAPSVKILTNGAGEMLQELRCWDTRRLQLLRILPSQPIHSLPDADRVAAAARGTVPHIQ